LENEIKDKEIEIKILKKTINKKSKDDEFQKLNKIIEILKEKINILGREKKELEEENKKIKSFNEAKNQDKNKDILLKEKNNKILKLKNNKDNKKNNLKNEDEKNL